MEIAQQKAGFAAGQRVDQPVPQGVIVVLLVIGERCAAFVGQIPLHQQRDFNFHRLTVERGNLIGAAVTHRQQARSRGLMECGKAGDALQIAVVYRRSIRRKYPIPPQILQQQNTLIDIHRQNLRGAKAVISKIIADRDKRAGVLGKMGDFRVGLAIRNDCTLEGAPPVHKDKVRAVSGNGLIGAC